MGTTSMLHPHRIFTISPPPPKHWHPAIFPAPKDLSVSSPQRIWKEAKNGRSLEPALNALQTSLRAVHKRKVAWPTDPSYLADLPPHQYLVGLLQPIADLFNHVHSKYVNSSMRCLSLTIADDIHGATFAADDFERLGIVPPVVITLLGNIFDDDGEVSATVQFTLSKALEHNSMLPSIIVSNYRDLAIFLPQNLNHPDNTFERVSTDRPLLSLQILSTAYLLRAFPAGFYIKIPFPDLEIDEGLVLPEGPPRDPNEPLASDEELLETHHRHSDFDIATLLRDKTRALQFFRWHELLRKVYTKPVAHPGDVLTAVTHDAGVTVPDDKPLYPLEVSEIPSDTAAHLKSVQRESPLKAAGILELLEQSKSFKLTILNVLSEGSERSICSVYQCRITSIDNKPVSSPTLCVKLFDDRIQALDPPDPDETSDDLQVARWFDNVVVAELYAVNEADAYYKLRLVQGSIVPWFYGVHQFTLPDGSVLQGLLMECVDGYGLDSDHARTLTTEAQIQMVRSCRYAVRILDLADVSQRDWHRGQIMVCRRPGYNLDHVVLIDLASTTQTWDITAPNYVANYCGALNALLGRKDDYQFDSDIVWEHFGKPDDWDPIYSIMPKVPGGMEFKVLKAPDMFPYIRRQTSL